MIVARQRLYGSEDQCLAAWVKVRRDAGMACPRCNNPKSYVYDRRVGCTRCDKRWSITSGTVMADTKLPLTIWFRAMHLMSSTKPCISAVELGRRLGVSYPTAWYLHKRLRHAMTQESDRCQLGAPVEGSGTPIVEADDVYLGGERNEGRGTAGKTRVIAAAERHPSGRMGAVAMEVVSSFSNAEAEAFRDAHIAPGAQVHTDGTPAFHVFGEGGRTHVATVTGGTLRANEDETFAPREFTLEGAEGSPSSCPCFRSTPRQPRPVPARPVAVGRRSCRHRLRRHPRGLGAVAVPRFLSPLIKPDVRISPHPALQAASLEAAAARQGCIQRSRARGPSQRQLGPRTAVFLARHTCRLAGSHEPIWTCRLPSL